MSNYYEDNLDLQFVSDHFVDWQKITPIIEKDFEDGAKYKESKDSRYEFAPNNTKEALQNYKSLWEAYAQVIEGELAPNVQEMDKEGLHFKDGKVIPPKAQNDFINTLKKTGIICYSVERQYGGLAFGQVARMPIVEMLSRADASTQIIISYYNMAEMVSMFGDEEMKAHYLPKFISGEVMGAMALTEPNIGSDLTMAATKAVQKEGREFELTGTKTFITQGCGFGEDTTAAIFTIARSIDRKGAFGLSFFLVETKDVQISRIEEKMGLHSSATCEVVYDKSKGILIGKEGYGLVKYAIKMMNGARVGIACQSMGIAQQAYSLAKSYASERVQFGVKIEELAPVKRMLDEMLARVQASRALIYRTGEILDLQLGLTHALLAKGKPEKAIKRDAEISKWDKISKVLTPLSKFTASEWCCKVAYDAVQVHGGVGYTEEYEIAKVYRDARITTIYEGTTQLQAIAIIGGIVEGVSDDSIFSNYIKEEFAKVKNDGVSRKLENYWGELINLTTIYKEQEKNIKDIIALELSWHLSYMFTTLLIAQQVEIAEKLEHPILHEKQEVLKTMLHLTDAQIASGKAYIHSVTS